MTGVITVCLAQYPSTRPARFCGNIFGVIAREEASLHSHSLKHLASFIRRGKISNEKIDPLLAAPKPTHSKSPKGPPQRIIALRTRNTTKRVINIGNSLVKPTTPIARQLFGTNPNPTISMDRPWNFIAFRPLDFSNHPDAPHPLSDKYHEWIPMFNGTNVTTAERHVHNLERHVHNFYCTVGSRHIEHEDIIMMLFTLSLDSDARDSNFSLPQGSITDWDTIHDTFKKRLATEVDGSMALDRFLSIAKTNKENVKEFTQRFDSLLREIHNRFKPSETIILDRYIKACRGHLTYVLKDKNPNTLANGKKIMVKVEQNVNVAPINMFNYHTVRIEPKAKPSSQIDPIIQAFAQKIENFTTEITQGQKTLMNRMTTLERK